jgi:hypothetical protein
MKTGAVKEQGTMLKNAVHNLALQKTLDPRLKAEETNALCNEN